MRIIRKLLIYKYSKNMTDHSNRDRTARPLSPCILICTLDDDKVCLGCGRNLAQISAWALMSIDQQWAVIDELDARSAELSGTIAEGSG